MYRVEIHRDAEKEIKNLPENTREKVIELLILLQTVPYPFKQYDLKKLKGFKNVYRIRMGKYRISYYVDDNSKLIIILEAKSRGEAYKNLGKRLP